jgi:hypothetical protein
VAFLDSDDEWLPTKLERQLARAEEARATVVSCVYQIKDDATGRAWPRRIPLIEAEAYDALLHGGRTPPPSLVMVRRTALTALGGFDDAILGFEDYDMWLRLARSGYRFAAVDAVLVIKHREHGSQLTRDHHVRMIGAEILETRWGAVVRERLGPKAHRRWLADRLAAPAPVQWMRVREAVARSNQQRAWQLCRATWRAPWHARWRLRAVAVIITLSGAVAHGLFPFFRKTPPTPSGRLDVDPKHE